MSQSSGRFLESAISGEGHVSIPESAAILARSFSRTHTQPTSVNGGERNGKREKERERQTDRQRRAESERESETYVCMYMFGRHHRERDDGRDRGQVSSEETRGKAEETHHSRTERTNERTHDHDCWFSGGRKGDRPRTYVRTYGRTNDGRCLSRGAASHWRLLAAPLPTSWLILDGARRVRALPRPSRSSSLFVYLRPASFRSVLLAPLSVPIGRVHLSFSHQPSRAPCTRDVTFDLHQGRLTLALESARIDSPVRIFFPPVFFSCSNVSVPRSTA